MFVCVCKGIRRSDLENLAAQGRRPGHEDVKKLTGAGTECGTCELRIQRVLKEIQQKTDEDNLTDSENAAG